MFIFYTYPELRDLSQGSRIVFVRQFRHKTQDFVSKELWLTGECKRRLELFKKGELEPPKERAIMPVEKTL